jgi:hypothetical protein
VKRARREIDVLPAEGERLADPQACAGEWAEQGAPDARRRVE